MRRPPQTRRPALRPVLALLGVSGVALVLPLAPRAAAIGGDAASVSQSTSPRETTGATPAVSLFQTSASSLASNTRSSDGGGNTTATSEVTATGSTTGGRDAGEERRTPRGRPTPTAAEERGESAGRRRTTRRREREEASTTARPSTRMAGGGGKAAVDTSKGDKATIVPVVKERIIFSLGGGWQSRYIYHGQDIIAFNSRQLSGSESSSIWFTNFSADYKGFQFKLDYVQAVDSTVPFLQGAPGTSDLPFFDDNGRRVSKRRIYREVDPGFSYTVGLGKLFDATIGYTFFLFPNDDFKGTHYEGETLVKLTYKQLKFIKPSFLYFYYNSPYSDLQAGDLNGSFVQLRIDGDVPLIERPQFAVRLQPYVLGNYNINFLRYNGSDANGNPSNEVGGWSSFETGLKVPITIAKRFTVTPFGNYGVNLADEGNAAINNLTNRGFGERTRFWGGVNISCTF